MSTPWEKELPQMALSCDFLMHGILSTAALHLAALNPGQQERFNYIAVQHQDLALGPFREAMSNITSDNCHNVFGFSMLLMISQFASVRSPDLILPSIEATSYQGPANWIVCLRGCSSIFNQARSHIKSGPLAVLISLGNAVEAVAANNIIYSASEDNQSLEYLAQNLLELPSIKSSTTVTEMEAYVESITWLSKLLAESSEEHDPVRQKAISFLWPLKLNETFIRLLSEQRPPALAIVAHYCLLLKRCQSIWFMEHRAYDLLNAVQQCLDKEWMPFVEHPLRSIQRC